jgi:hypothetical protein
MTQNLHQLLICQVGNREEDIGPVKGLKVLRRQVVWVIWSRALKRVPLKTLAWSNRPLVWIDLERTNLWSSVSHLRELASSGDIPSTLQTSPVAQVPDLAWP